MHSRLATILFFALLHSSTLKAQCVDKDFVLERINFLQNSASINNQHKLKELLQLEDYLKRCSQTHDSLYSLLLRKIGIVYYHSADYLSAVQYTLRSANILRGIGENTTNLQHISDCYYNLTIYYDSLKEVSLQIEAIDSCIAIDLRINSDYYNSCILIEKKIRYLFNNGDYGLCIKYADLEESLLQKYYHYPDSLENILYVLTYKVDALVFLKDFTNAEKLLVHKVRECEILGKIKFLGTIYGLLALTNKFKKDYNGSIYYFKKCYKYNLMTGYRKGCAEALNNIGVLYLEGFHQGGQALLSNRKALIYADAVDSIYALDNIANVYVNKQMFDSAFYFFQQSFDQIKPGMDVAELLNDKLEENLGNKTTEYVTRLILDKGDAFLHEYKSENIRNALLKANIIYKEADEFLSRIKSRQLEVDSRLFWRGYAVRLYEHAIEACYLQSNYTDAFYFFEKSRAVLLNDQLNEREFVAEVDILAQSRLKEKILEKERELKSMDKGTLQYGELEKDVFRSKQELAVLQNRIKEKNPLYFQTFIDSGFISIHDVQNRILKDHKAVIEILSGDSAVYLLAITTQEVRLNKIDKKVFDTLSADYSNYISHPDLLNKNFDNYVQISNQLYQLMFQNINLPAGRIIISPDGKYFPFEALVTSIRPRTYFLEDHAASYTYSARYLLNNFRTDSAIHANAFMGIAPVQYTNGLPSLSGSDQSIQRIQDYFSNASSFTGSKAKKNNFLNEFYKYRIIQLYTHATDSGSNGEPMIYFADSPLNLSDLLPEKKPATDLIVLSACQTASGKLYSGEGVFSFNRSFAALGIPSSVSNLWQVDNKSTYRLTELFYKYMSRGMPLDIALQKAKKEFIKTTTLDENKLPYYWAASILVGKTDAISLQKKYAWWPITGISILASIVLGGWIIRWRSRSSKPKPG